jgi:peptidoglycan/xylan/chitin deacetylase (PgdA/CDA1 family)
MAVRRRLWAAVTLICMAGLTGCQPPAEPAPPAATAAPTPAVSAPGAAAAAAIPASLLGQDVEVIPTSQKVVALTFDAGANADGLPAILSTLTSQNVKATFFVTGNFANANPTSVRDITARGHRLGNHSMTHPYLTKLSDAAVLNEINGARTAIMAAGGGDPKPFFRFPYGDRTAHTISLVNGAGYIAVSWTVDTLGWKGTSGGVTTQTVVDRAVGAARPGEIVLMHVGSNPDDHTTLDATALPTVIAKLKALGYGFVTLDTLLGAPTPTAAACDAKPWRAAPITVTHAVAVPPVPVVTGIRTGSHPECRFDRLVFDISGALPGYRVRYVSSVTADPSGQPITVPGSKFLLVTLTPAQGHTVTGTPTITPKSATVNYPMLKAYAVAGDFEGYVTVALGLAAQAQVRVGELSGRIYIDVAY